MKALIPASLIAILCVVIPGLDAMQNVAGIEIMKTISNFSLLIAMVIGGWIYYILASKPATPAA